MRGSEGAEGLGPMWGLLSRWWVGLGIRRTGDGLVGTGIRRARGGHVGVIRIRRARGGLGSGGREVDDRAQGRVGRARGSKKCRGQVGGQGRREGMRGR